MNYNKKIRILIISDSDYKYDEKSTIFRGTSYDIETSSIKTSELSNLEAYCKHHFDIIISEVIDFSDLKKKNECLINAETDETNLICKNFFKFHGTFILLNKRFDELGYSKPQNEDFPYCYYFKEIIISGSNANKQAIFQKEVELQLKKTLALDTNFTFTKTLFLSYLKSQFLTAGFLLQLLPYILLCFLVAFSFAGNDVIDRKILEWLPFNGSHLYHKFAVVRPVSLIIIIWTCLMYLIFHLQNLFGFINNRNSKGKFGLINVISNILLVFAMIVSFVRLFDGRFSFDNNSINTIKSTSFIFSDLMILICLFLVDLIILMSAYSSSNSKFITKKEEINLSNIYTIYFNTLILCDLPILFGNIFLFLYESKIVEDNYRFVYSLGTASASLFILQLIYFSINIKSTYDEYLTS